MIPSSPREWLDQIQLAIRYRDAYDRKARWQRNRDWFMGKYDAGLIAVNIVFGIGRGLIPQTYFKSPTLGVRPRPGDPMTFAARMVKAKLLNAVDSYLIQEMQLKKTLKHIILDAFLYNVGIIKVGYHSLETELAPQDDDTTDVMDAMGDLMGAPTQAAPDKRDWYGYHDLVKPEMPWALRVAPDRFVVAPGCATIEEAPWCAFQFTRRFDEIMAADVYPMRLKRNLRPNARVLIEGEANVSSPTQIKQIGVAADDEYVEGWEIWDKRTESITVVVDGHDKFLRDEPHGWDINGLPVVIYQLNPVGGDFWGISHVDAIAPQVSEYNETRTHEMLHRKMSSLKLLLDRNLLKPEEIVKVESGKVLPIILTEGSPTASYAFLQPNMSRDIYKVAEDIFEDIKTIIGFNRNQAGDFESSRRTATEVNRVAQQNLIRDDELRDMMADMISDLFSNKIHPLIFQNWKTPRVFEVTGMEGWVPVVGSQLRGNYDVIVVPDSTLPISKAQAKQDSASLFQMFNNDPFTNQIPLRKQLLDKFEDIKVEELLKTPDQVAQEQQAAQQQQMQMMVMSKVLGEGAKTQPPQLKSVKGGKQGV